jgi:hypothetical protein
LKAIFFDDSRDTASTDGDTGLSELLGNDVDRGIGIEEAVADDLSFDFVGPNRVGLGPAFLVSKGEGAVSLKLREQLMIALSRDPVLLGSVGSAEGFAFSF